MQVFRPFYEDTSLMKDMAWTKNFNNTLGSAEGLNKSTDLKQKEQYWDEGIQALQYKRKEFMEATPEEAMSFENPVYTPYVNVQKKSAEIFKDSGISMDISDTDGKYIIRQKNGDILTEPLSKLLQSQLSADPMVKAVYDTKAYLNRKQFAAANAEKFGGEKQAEMKYLEDAYGKMKKTTEDRHADSQNISKVYDAKIKDIKNQIATKGSNPLLENQLRQYESNKQINDEVLASLSEQVERFNNAYSSSGNTSTGWHNPYKDINTLRYIVDNSMSNDLFSDDVMRAATDLSKREMVRDIEPDPFAIIEMRHAKRMAEINKQAYFDKYDYDGNLKPVKSSGGKKSSDENNTSDENNDAFDPFNNSNGGGNTTDNYNTNTSVKKDSWGRPEGSKWFGWDPNKGKYTEGKNKGKNKLPIEEGPKV